MDKETPQFKDKVALITGAASGIGKATALEFAAKGARIVLADINEAKGLETLKEIQNGGGQAIFRKTDVSQAKEVEQLIAETIRSFGRLDFAHNNAGIEGRRAKLAAYSEEEWDRVIEINLKGVWLCMKYEIPHMLKQGKGAIVNTSSVAGLSGLRKFSPYSASKHGIAGLTKTAALEYARSGIRINAVSPGMIDTEMIERGVLRLNKELSGFSGWVERIKKKVAYRFLEKNQPLGRMGKPQEVARVVAWLCSEEASFITGSVWPVDGGYLSGE